MPDGHDAGEAQGPPGAPRGHDPGPRDPGVPGSEAALGGASLGLTPSLRLLLSLAAGAIVLVFMRSAASVINPLLLAVVITMAVSPLLHLLVRKGLPLWLAWLITVVVTLVAVAAVVAAGLDRRRPADRRGPALSGRARRALAARDRRAQPAWASTLRG